MFAVRFVVDCGARGDANDDCAALPRREGGDQRAPCQALERTRKDADGAAEGVAPASPEPDCQRRGAVSSSNSSSSSSSSSNSSRQQ